jgi:hypothetical protein
MSTTETKTETKIKVYWVVRRKATGEYFQSSQAFCLFSDEALRARRWEGLADVINEAKIIAAQRINRKETVGEVEIVRVRVYMELDELSTVFPECAWQRLPRVTTREKGEAKMKRVWTAERIVDELSMMEPEEAREVVSIMRRVDSLGIEADAVITGWVANNMTVRAEEVQEELVARIGKLQSMNDVMREEIPASK